MDTFVCSKCQVEKPDDAYSWARGYRNGSRCKACLTEIRRLERAARPPKPAPLRDRDLTEKRCNMCSIVKPVADFYWNQRKWSPKCRGCITEAQRQARKADPETIRKRERESKARAPEDVQARRHDRMRAYYTEHHDRLLLQKREFWLARRDEFLAKYRERKILMTPEEIRAARVAGQAAMAPEVKARKLAALSRAKLAEWAKLDHAARLERLSNAHGPDARAAGGMIRRGRVRSAEHCAKLSATHKERTRDPVLRERFAARSKRWWSDKTRDERLAHTAAARALSLATKSNTSIERAVAAILDELGIVYEQQVEIFGYSLDFLIRDRSLVIECDGTYWHSLPGRSEHDRRRDKCISGCGYRIVRLSETEIVADARSAVMFALINS